MKFKTQMTKRFKILERELFAEKYYWNDKKRFWHLDIWIWFEIWVLTFGLDTDEKACEMDEDQAALG